MNQASGHIAVITILGSFSLWFGLWGVIIGVILFILYTISTNKERLRR